MARPKSKGAYVPLAAHYFMDDAILEAGPDAELLFVRCLSFLASVTSNGFITDRQVKTIVGLGLRNVPKRLEKLPEVGLLEAAAGGFVVRSWTKWNKTPEEIGKLLARDRERKAQKQADSGANSGRNPGGIQSDSIDQSSTEQSRAEELPIGSSSSDAEASDPIEYSDEVKALCEELAGLVRANGHKVGKVGATWWKSCERLLRIDEYTPQQIRWLMHWATADEFWASNIRSMPTFREKFSTLKAQSQSRARGSQGQKEQNEAIALVEKYREKESHAAIGDGSGSGVLLGGGSSPAERAVG